MADTKEKVYGLTLFVDGISAHVEAYIPTTEDAVVIKDFIRRKFGTRAQCFFVENEVQGSERVAEIAQEAVDHMLTKKASESDVG